MPMMNSFYPSYQPFPQQYSSPYQQANILPPQQVLQASGKSSIDALRMSPNSSALIMDSTAPMVWLCTSDSLGNVSSTPYDISPHKDAPPVDTTTLESRLATVEASITKLWEEWNGVESDAGNADTKQTIGSSRSDGPH